MNELITCKFVAHKSRHSSARRRRGLNENKHIRWSRLPLNFYNFIQISDIVTALGKIVINVLLHWTCGHITVMSGETRVALGTVRAGRALGSHCARAARAAPARARARTHARHSNSVAGEGGGANLWMDVVKLCRIDTADKALCKHYTTWYESRIASPPLPLPNKLIVLHPLCQRNAIYLYNIS